MNLQHTWAQIVRKFEEDFIVFQHFEWIHHVKRIERHGDVFPCVVDGDVLPCLTHIGCVGGDLEIVFGKSEFYRVSLVAGHDFCTT